jgi:hypothetical protein
VYGNNNPNRYADPDGKSVVAALLVLVGLGIGAPYHASCNTSNHAVLGSGIGRSCQRRLDGSAQLTELFHGIFVNLYQPLEVAQEILFSDVPGYDFLG